MSAPHHLSAAWQDADALRTRGQLAAARDLLEPVADVAAIRLGADNPDVIETMRRLATVHRELGELASARRVLEEALEGAQLRLRDDDPVVLGISADLGSIADELGNRHEARRNFTRVARYGPTVLGAQHPQVRAAQRFLGADAPVPEPAPEAQAGFAPAAGYESPPPGYAPPEPPPSYPAPPGHAAPPSHAAPPGHAAPPSYPAPPGHAAPPGYAPPEPPPSATPERHAAPEGYAAPDGYAAPEPQPSPAYPPLVQEQPGVYRPGERTLPEPPPRAVAHPPPVPPPYPELTSPYPELTSAHEEHHRSRLPLIVLAVIAVAALVAATVIAVIAFRGRHQNPAPPQVGPTVSTSVGSPAPSGSAPAPPRDVRLRDSGDTVTLTWTDPSGGTVPFFVEAGPAGTQLRIIGQLRPGETTFPVAGLNPKLDYCFSVVAVYSANLVAPSDLVCTQRTGKPAASPSR